MAATGKRLAILQSNYIPWKGYFDLIGSVDEFIIFDDAQYTKNDWRNRNKIKTAQGVQWLTIPIETSGKLAQRINEAAIKGDAWREKHFRTLCMNYSKARFFSDYRPWLERLYASCTSQFLSQVNFLFLSAICAQLMILTKLSSSRDYRIEDGQTERLVSLCKQAGATIYLSGPAARDYIDPALFEQAGIELVYKQYSYPEYPQLYPPFEHGVSVLDLLFNAGPDARSYIFTNM